MKRRSFVRISCAWGCACAILILAHAQAVKGPEDIEALIAEGELDTAISSARAAVESSPDNPDLHMVLGRALATKGRRMQRVLEAAPGDPNGPVPTAGRIEVRYDPRLLEEALAEIRTAIRLAPARKEFRFGECYLLTDAGEIDRASSAIRETIAALPAEPGLATALASYGSERAMRGDAAGGATLVGVVASAFPKAAHVQVDYARALARNGEREEALLALRRAGELEPENLAIQRQRALIALLLQGFELSRDAFRDAYALSREDPDRFGAAAAIFGLDPAASRPEFEELAVPAASADPTAVEMARYFIAAVPNSGARRMELVNLLIENKRDLLALPVIHRMLMADPGHAEARAALARVYRMMRFPIPASGPEID